MKRRKRINSIIMLLAIIIIPFLYYKAFRMYVDKVPTPVGYIEVSKFEYQGVQYIISAHNQEPNKFAVSVGGLHKDVAKYELDPIPLDPVSHLKEVTIENINRINRLKR